MIQRWEFLERLKSFREKDVIKVVAGVRRCGKSTLFDLYQEHLRLTGVLDEQIIALNLEDMEHAELLDYKQLYAYIKERLCVGKYTYVFIDEVQNCKGFERVIDSLFIKKNVDVYITGSNAYMLSGELATLLSGRYVTIEMLPLSFKEYSEAQPSLAPRDCFAQYLRWGGFPYIATALNDEASALTYLEGVYSSILLKDVAQREQISDVALLERIAKTLASCIGSPVSVKKICDTLVSAGRRISINSVDNYMKALCDAYIFYKTERYDIKGRQNLKTLGKYYLVDTGLRRLLTASSTSDLGHVIENIVYFELRRRGYQVHVGKQGTLEVDFVARKLDSVLYVQVSASVLDEATLERELRPLQMIKDHHSKILLSLDEIGAQRNFDGIPQLNLIDWLLD